MALFRTMAGMRLAALLLAFLVSSNGAFAQHAPAPRRPPAQMSHEERQRLRQDVDSARGNYQQRREARPPERMAPEEREKLRRDVQDANRDLRRRR